MRSIAQKVFKNTLWLTGAEIFTYILSAIGGLLVIRALGDVDYGKYGFALAFVALFNFLLDFGLHTLFVSDVSKDKSLLKKYLGNILILKLALNAVALALMVLVIQLLSKGTDEKLIVYLVSLTAFFGSFNYFLYSVFRTFEKMKYEAFTKIIKAVLTLGVALLIFFFNLGVVALAKYNLYIMAFSLLVTFVLVFKKFARPVFEIDLTFWKKIIKGSWPLAVSVFLIAIFFSFDTVMLSLLKSNETVGWYSANYKLIIMLVTLNELFFGALFPVLSMLTLESKEKLKHVLKKTIKYLYIIFLPIVASTAVLAKPIIVLLFGEEFIPGTLSLQILIWVVIVIVSASPFAYALLAFDKRITYLKVVLFGAIFNILLNLVLIPRFSLNGAAIATVISSSFVFFGSLFAFSKIMKINPVQSILKPLISTFLTVTILYFLIDLNIILLIFIGAVAYACFILVFKTLKNDDFTLIKNLIQNKKKD